MNHNSSGRIRLLLFCLINFGLTFAAAAQYLPNPKIVSPNATALDKFTEVPVDYFTGTPQVEIPIHTLEYGSIRVPISLRYHPASVMPAQQPGWVGLGWDLQSFGAITRRLRGYHDDLYGSPGNGNIYTEPTSAVNAYYPVPGNVFANCGAQLANALNWDATSQMFADFSASADNPSGLNDVQADEFAFDFMGYSGTFYYSGPTLGWQVVSKDNITVTLNGFLPAGNIINSILQYKQLTGTPCTGCNAITAQNQPNQFSGFTLTVPDGTQYVFGGQNAIEYDDDYLYQGNAPNGEIFVFWASSWLLTQIIDPNKNVVNFTYQRAYPTCNLGFGATDLSFTANLGKCSTSLLSSGNILTTTHSGIYQWPMYLSSISSPNETITFNISDATCLRYPDLALQSWTSQALLQVNGGNDITPDDHVYLSLLNGLTSNLRWEQLNSVVITNNLPAGSNIYRQYVFNYSSSTSQRLTLNNFTEEDDAGSTIAQYVFGYNNVAGLPAAMDGDQTDAWGYYNATPENGYGITAVYSLKQPNASVLTTGLLSKITYPTGGYTTFSWEPNDYSQVVTIQRNGVTAPTSTATTAGGCRINEISSYDVNSNMLLDKKYYYRRGYSSVQAPANLVSSGILNGTPVFFEQLNNRTSYSGQTTVSYTTGSLNSMGAYSYTGEGAFVGYDEVAEVNPDGSYIRHFFTSYPADVNLVTHYDSVPLSYLGWLPGEDTYLPMSDMSLERGKPIQTLEYTPNNVLVRKTLMTYRSDPTRFGNEVNLLDFSSSLACNAGDAVIFMSARKQYTYTYYPVSKSVTIFDQNGSNPINSTETYTYNANNLLSTKTIVNSKGETEATTYNYPTDFTDATSTAMAAAHIISPIVEATTTVNGQPASQVHTIYYTPSSGLYEPQTVQAQVAANPVETRQSFYNYDAYGNAVEMSKTNDIHTVYLWSYNGAYPVARIENSTYSAVTAIVSQSTLNTICTPGNDANVRSLLQTLRSSLPNALVTSYTYLPGTGMTSETDPQGRTTYYEYDSYRRLRTVRDFNQNVIKTYSYQYAN